MQFCSEIKTGAELEACLFLPVMFFNGAKAAMYAPQVSVGINSAPDG